MKIAIIIERADVVLGGAERSVFELAAVLLTLGLDVHILAAKGQQSQKNIHLLCQNAPEKRVPYFTFAKALKKHLSQNSYDIIHSVLPFDFADVYQPRGGAYAQAGLRNAASYQNSFLVSYKKITAFANLRRTILMRAEKTLCKDPNGPVIAALSQYVANQFKREYGVADHRIVVIPNGVKIYPAPIEPEPQRYKPAAGASLSLQDNWCGADGLRSQILAQLNLKEVDKPILFLFVANNFRLKGLRPLIKAMHLAAPAASLLRSKTAGAYLVVAGRDNSRKYLRLAKKLNVHKRIAFLGKVRHIQNALSATDVAVLPTFYDPASRFLLEALANNKPVITTKFNGAIDLFVDGRHGKVIDSPENIPALADAINYFSDVKNIQRASAAIVQDNLNEKISINRAANQLTALYESILKKRRQQ